MQIIRVQWSECGRAEQKHAGNGSADQRPECDRAEHTRIPECGIDDKLSEYGRAEQKQTETPECGKDDQLSECGTVEQKQTEIPECGQAIQDMTECGNEESQKLSNDQQEKLTNTFL